MKLPVTGNETKIFDPRDAAAASPGVELLDATVFHKDGQWRMILAGQPGGFGATDIFEAELPAGEPLSERGWRPMRDASGSLRAVAGRERSAAWDGKGGRHCPSYVKGWDPHQQKWVERIYYAGAAEDLWGPYTIGFLEWDGEKWLDRLQPAFAANEDWEHGSVYEPNLIYHEGKWKMWYVAGSNYEDYLVHGYSESADGVTDWTRHEIFAEPEIKMFDFCVRQTATGFDAIFARVWMGKGALPAATGLWWCRSENPSGKLSEWSPPIQIMTAEDKGWHSGPWKPSFDCNEQMPRRAWVFFDGLYPTGEPGPFPFVFTLGCFPLDLP